MFFFVPQIFCSTNKKRVSRMNRSVYMLLIPVLTYNSCHGMRSKERTIQELTPWKGRSATLALACMHDNLPPHAPISKVTVIPDQSPDQPQFIEVCATNNTFAGTKRFPLSIPNVAPYNLSVLRHELGIKLQTLNQYQRRWKLTCNQFIALVDHLRTFRDDSPKAEEKPFSLDDWEVVDLNKAKSLSEASSDESQKAHGSFGTIDDEDPALANVAAKNARAQRWQKRK
jgi:hypothetical protein